MRPNTRDVTANGLRHRVLEWDGGGRTTVLCLHGFLDLALAFHRVAPALAAAGHHVVAPDLRGHGETEWIGAGGWYHYVDYLLDVADLTDALARDRLAIAGHSMGASLACYFAGAFPERVWRIAAMEGLRLPDMPAASFPDRIATWTADVRRVRGARRTSPRAYASVEAAAARLRQHDPLCPEEEARVLARAGTREVPGGWVFRHDPLHLARGPYPFRLDQALAVWSRVRCPALFLEGALSEPPPPDYAARLAAFRDARCEVIEGAGHMMMRHRPDAIARALVAFFAE